MATDTSYPSSTEKLAPLSLLYQPHAIEAIVLVGRPGHGRESEGHKTELEPLLQGSHHPPRWRPIIRASDRQNLSRNLPLRPIPSTIAASNCVVRRRYTSSSTKHVIGRSIRGGAPFLPM